MSKFDNLSARSRYFRVLLYPDNLQHQAAFTAIKAVYPSDYIGITHKEQDGEKEHMHIVLWFDNPRKTESVCRVLGFVDDLGTPDDQFVRAICKQQGRRVEQQLKSSCIYLLHKNAPEKEQYEISDLFGDKDKIAWTAKQCVKYQSNDLDMSDSVSAVLDWIARQDDIIKVFSFGKWLCGSPYFKANGNRIVWAALREHNMKIFEASRPSGFGSVSPSDVEFRELTESEWESMRFIWGCE